MTNEETQELARILSFAGEAIERQRPKRVFYNIKNYECSCPNCGWDFEYKYENFCSHCGQALDWGDEE